MELFGKFSIMGFFGFAPKVRIKVQDLGKQINRLTLLFFLDGDPGEYSLTLEILNPTSDLIKSATLSETKIVADQAAVAAVNVSGLPLATAGKYVVRLLENADEIFSTTFDVEKGDPELFQH